MEAFRAVSFDWVKHLSGVWEDPDYHVTEVNPKISKDFEKYLYDLAEKYQLALQQAQVKGVREFPERKSPLGLRLTGPAGSGKTHMLGILRQKAMQMGSCFVLVDMTGVKDFWETTLLGYWSSLQQPMQDGRLQLEYVMESLLYASRIQVDDSLVKKLAKMSIGKCIEISDLVLSRMAKLFGQKNTLLNQDIVRALFLLNMEDFVLKNIGYSWLQGLEIEASDRAKFKFGKAQKSPLEIVKGLSWLMSLHKPTVLAFDQLDLIVSEYHRANSESISGDQSSEFILAKQIIQNIGNGFLSIVDETWGTQAVISCLEQSWNKLEENNLQSFADRYRKWHELQPLSEKRIHEEMIVSRLRGAYGTVGYAPPYRSWPFKSSCFESIGSIFPRELLKRCDEHWRNCVSEGVITEIESLDRIHQPPAPDAVRNLTLGFEKYRAEAKPYEIFAEENEDDLVDRLLETACLCLAEEISLGNNIDASVDVDFPGGKIQPLHVRIRLIFRNEGDREEQCSFRAILKTNALAFQARLKAAITATGIDRNLPFRRLVIVRPGEVPKGAKTEELVRRLLTAGGCLAKPQEEEIRTLWAVYAMRKEAHPLFRDWLLQYKPISHLPMMKTAVEMFQAAGLPLNATESKPDEKKDVKEVTPPSKMISDRVETSSPVIRQNIPEKSASSDANKIPIGRRLIGDKLQDTIELSSLTLRKHTAILAGAGSGKTVLVKRMVEEAALMGIPSIVVDCANDLAGLGDVRSQRPETWGEADGEKATLYHKNCKVIIWTPGYQKGNPLILEPIPDLASLVNDADELEQAIEMIREWLRAIVARGNSASDQNKQGVISAALRYFARHGAGKLNDFVNLLSHLPDEASGGISSARKLSMQMADSLRAEIQINLLLKQSGTSMDPRELFGLDRSPGIGLISVINFCGLKTLESQRTFLNQLAMTLFTWIKKHPAPSDHPLRGLLVIDEAKDFVPANQQTACRISLLRLTAQARKYGLGLVFASQEPKSIDNKIISNCSTQFYGKVNSLAAIEAAQQMIRFKGGDASDIARLPAGQFYLATEDLPKSVKVAIPACLSDHRTLEETEVLQRAQR